MSLVKKAIKTYREDGISKVSTKAKSYISNNISPKPTVANNSTLFPLWSTKYIYNIIFDMKHGNGVDVMTEDWDTLILLDACRYDSFQEMNHLNGNLEYRISKAVDSPRFIEKNFVGRNLYDTVYVTANPHVDLLDNNTFHDIIATPLSNWDESRQCVPPDEVTQAGINAHHDFPNKRIIIHYMQPHDPPLGPTAEQLRSEHNISGPRSEGNKQGNRIMELASNDQISSEIAHKAYKETLQIALHEVEKLVSEINGKVVVSADHGEMFGENPYFFLGELYEHFQNPKTKELCKVPWFTVHNNNKRRKIVSEDTENNKNTSNVNIEEQLDALGYR
jgi:hypothetical protein